MDEHDLFRLINKVLPFLVFVGWAFISIFAKGRKRPTAPPGKNVTSPKSSRDSDSMTDSSEKPAGKTVKDLKKTLQTMFEEIGIPLESAEEPVPEENAVLAEYPDVVTEPDEDIPEYSAPMEVIAASDNRQSELDPPVSRQYGGFNSISREALRNGVIWSEILSAPVSLRR